MKKVLVLLITILTLTTVHAQKKAGNYFQIGTSIDHTSWGQEVQFGGFIGKHQLGLVLASSGEQSVFDRERPWYGGVVYQFSTPIANTISLLANGKAKVNLRGAETDLVLEPGVGLGFNISPAVQFQTGISTRFDKQLNHGYNRGQVDLGLNFKF